MFKKKKLEKIAVSVFRCFGVPLFRGLVMPASAIHKTSDRVRLDILSSMLLDLANACSCFLLRFAFVMMCLIANAFKARS